MDQNLISVFGATGFIGSQYCSLYSDKIIKINREDRSPKSRNILYFISTVDNYNVHTNITLDVETNLKVLCEVLDYCRDDNITFNFISSWFVYGETELPAKEDYYCMPTGFYSITKKAAEDLLISFCKIYKVNYRILRLCNVYGPSDNKVSKKKNAIQYMINLLKEDVEVSLYDGGTPIRDLMHRDDVCNAIDLILEKGELNTIYNVGSGHPTTVYDIIEMAKEMLQSNSPITSIETPEFHSIVQIKDFWMNTSKLESLGFKQKITLEKGIEELCLS
jgi:nucleoside-diphosphate-sugar epimerase